MAEVACPICATPVTVGCSRCSSCTVNVKWRDSAPVAAGWRGGDPVAAGAALRKHTEPSEAEQEPLARQQALLEGCGTNAGYERHRYYNEDACADCKKAHNERKKRLRREANDRKRLAA